MKSIRQHSGWLVALVYFLFGLPMYAFAGNTTTSPSSNPLRQQFGAYCGVYSLYAAGIREGIEIEFPSLLRTQYIACSKGSSLEALRQAAVDHGLYALPMTTMSAEVLRVIDHPVILYVRSRLESPIYDHYVVYLGQRGDRWQILDPSSDDLQLLSKAQLLAIWSGVGMIVSAHPIETSKVFRASFFEFGLWGMASLLMVLTLKMIMRRLSGKGFIRRIRASAGLQILSILLVGSAVGLAYHGTASAGLLVNQNFVSEMASADLPSFIPKISVAQARRAAASGEVSFVDARMSEDYEAGHIPGAISIPIDLNADRRRAAMASISKSRPLVVYCESSGCPFAKAVGSELIRDGFSDISVYADGWEGWNDGTESK